MADEPQISFKFAYDVRRFEADTVERIASLFHALLQEMAYRPAVTLGELPRIPASDASRLVAFNATQADTPGPLLVHEWFEQQLVEHIVIAELVAQRFFWRRSMSRIHGCKKVPPKHNDYSIQQVSFAAAVGTDEDAYATVEQKLRSIQEASDVLNSDPS